MCDPIVIGVISAAGSIVQGAAAQSAANANALAAQRNADNFRWQANQTEEKKARELSELNFAKRQTLAKQRVAMAGMGLDSQYGSGLNQLESTAVLAKKDEDNLEWNAALQKWGYDAQAASFDWQAGAYRTQGKNAMLSGIIGAGATLAGGLSSLNSPRQVNTQTINPDSYAKAAATNQYGLVSPKWTQWNKASTYGNYGFRM